MDAEWNAWISDAWDEWAIAFLLGSVAAFLLGRLSSHLRYKHRNAAFVHQLQEARDTLHRAERSSASKGDFLANMSHEVRTPLNSMIGTAELLLSTELNARQRVQLRTILTSAESLLGIINDILDLSKIENGKLTLDHVPFSVRTLVEEVTELFTPRARERDRKAKLEMVVDVAADLPEQGMGDPARLRQILSNLMSNAVKFTAHGSIVLRAEPTLMGGAAGVRFTVADTGIGIAADKRELVFDKFVQAEGNTTTRQFGGTGLGLSICRQLVGLMQGTLQMESVVDKGTSFYVDIPLPVVEAAKPIDAQWRERFVGRRALIVDDTVASAEWLRQALSQLGIRSFIAEDRYSAATTLHCAQEAGVEIDYLFVEYQLHHGNGPELLELLASDLKGSTPYRVGMSMGDDAQMVRAFQRIGSDGFLRKPALISSLHTLLDRLEEHSGFVNSLTFASHHPMDTSEPYPDYHGRPVLLVEDNRTNRELALEMLSKFQIEADAAENGQEALNMATARRYELILMDCQMPQMDGFEASRLLRQRMQAGDIAHVPIIALTANAMKGDRERCLEAGMNDYLCKPLRLQEIRAMLDRWIAAPAEREDAA